MDLNGLLAREPEWLSKDGVHPSEDGNAIIAKHIATAVAPLVANRSTANQLDDEPHDADIGNKDVIGGLSREFYQRVARHYQKDRSWTRESREEFFASRSKRTELREVMGKNASMWTFEPSVAQAIFAEMLQEVLVNVRRQQRLKRVVKSGSRIMQIETEDGQTRFALDWRKRRQLADDVDTRWSFSFVDIDNSGTSDTLRIEAKIRQAANR